MKTKSILTGCVAMAAMAACLIPLLAQEPANDAASFDRHRQNDSAKFAQRESADLYTAIQGPTAPQATAYYSGQRNLGDPPNSQQAPMAGLATTRSLFGQSVLSAFDPALAKTINDSNLEVGKLSKQLKETDEQSEKDSIKEKIKTELDLQYDAYLENHEKPLKQLEERLAKLRQEFEARKQAKDDLVKLRLDTIWYDSLGLGWPSNRTTRSWRINSTTGSLTIPGAPRLPSAVPLPPTPPTPPAVPNQSGR